MGRVLKHPWMHIVVCSVSHSILCYCMVSNILTIPSKKIVECKKESQNRSIREKVIQREKRKKQTERTSSPNPKGKESMTQKENSAESVGI